MDPVLITAILSILLAAAILIVVIISVFPVSHFIYSDAVIQSKSTQLVKDKTLLEMTESKDLGEIKTLLTGTDYQTELEKLPLTVTSYHKAIEKSYLNSVKMVQDLCPEKLKPLVDAFIMQLESKIIKMIYRAKYLQISVDENMVFSIGNISQNLIRRLTESKDVAEFHEIMKKTVYRDVFNKEYESLEDFEVSLESFVLNKMVEASNNRIYHKRFVRQIVAYRTDVLNIMTLLKLHVKEVPVDQRIKYILPDEGLVHSKARKLAKAESIEAFVGLLKGTRYQDIMESALQQYQKDKSITHFEDSLSKGFKHFVTDNELHYSLGPVPLISYMVKKEFEMKNLFLITKMVSEQVNLEITRSKII